MRRRTALAALAVAVAAGACSGDEGPGPTTTADSTTATTAASTTATTAPLSVARRGLRITEATDLCFVLGSGDLERIFESDPGRGDLVREPDQEAIVDARADPGRVVFALAECRWTLGDLELTLTYLSPTVAETGTDHLSRVVSESPEFAGGARLAEVVRRDVIVSALIDEEADAIEMATVNQGALVYTIAKPRPAEGSIEFNTLASITAIASRRVPPGPGETF